MSEMRQLAAAVLAVIVMAVPATDAAAHTMPKRKAVSVAKSVVKKIAGETKASGGSVLSCRRQTSHRFLCAGELRYRTGANRCTFDIAVRYTSRTTQRTKSSVANYRCF